MYLKHECGIHPILAILAHSYVALCICFYVSTLPMLAPSYFYDFEFGLLGFSLISKIQRRITLRALFFHD